MNSNFIELIQLLFLVKQEAPMTVKYKDLDEITVKTIADHLVCPFVADCFYFDFCNRPDLNSLRYITHFCGDQFLQCKFYKVHLAELGNKSEPSGPPARAD